MVRGVVRSCTWVVVYTEDVLVCFLLQKLWSPLIYVMIGIWDIKSCSFILSSCLQSSWHLYLLVPESCGNPYESWLNFSSGYSLFWFYVRPPQRSNFLNFLLALRSPNLIWNTVVPSYLWVICSKTYRGYVKPRIISNAINNVIFV
jgi:hypothetical protein